MNAAQHSKLRLIAFQFAGSNRYAYRPLERELGSSIELCSFELPGRAGRSSEPLLLDLPAMVADVFHSVAGCVQGSPYALFGHSMGARLAQLTALRLLERGLPAPRCLVVSASAGPSCPVRTRRHLLAQHDFLNELRSLGGIPEQILNEPELMQLFLPVLRADFRALETYRAEPGPRLPCPITMLRGVADPEVSRAEAEAWAAETSATFSMHELPGGHFFLFERAREVAALIRSAVAGVESGPE